MLIEIDIDIDIDKDIDIETEKEQESDAGSEKIPPGYGTNTGFTPCVTPKRERKPIGRVSKNQDDSYYTSASDSESVKRKRQGGFKIPRIPSKTPTPQKEKAKEKELEEKDRQIEELKKQLNDQMNANKQEESKKEETKKPGTELTPA